MSAMESAGEAIDLIRENSDIANNSGGCSAELLARAESELGVQFPPSYRKLVSDLGTWDIGGEEFLGVYQTRAYGDELLGSVRETIRARLMQGLPGAMIVTMFDGMGGLIVIDTARQDASGESPVLAWTGTIDTPAAVEFLAPDYGSYALRICKNAIRYSSGES
jgi:antitoxin YobK